MFPPAIDRIPGHVLEDVVHPAHVPLVGETQAADVDRTADRRPRGRFLRDGDRPGLLGVRERVQLTHKLDRFEILAAAEPVRNPLPFLSRVVEIQHRRDRIDAKPVDVVLVQPEQRIREAESYGPRCGRS